MVEIARKFEEKVEIRDKFSNEKSYSNYRHDTFIQAQVTILYLCLWYFIVLSWKNID